MHFDQCSCGSLPVLPVQPPKAPLVLACRAEAAARGGPRFLLLSKFRVRQPANPDHFGPIRGIMTYDDQETVGLVANRQLLFGDKPMPTERLRGGLTIPGKRGAIFNRDY